MRKRDSTNDAKMSNHKTGGGAATSAGINYQARVTAWFAIGILAEQEFALPDYLPATATITAHKDVLRQFPRITAPHSGHF